MTGSHPLSIAIVGMSCRLPGASNLESFWELLLNGRSAIEELPDQLVNRSLYYDPSPGKVGRTYSTVGGLVPGPHPPADEYDSCHRLFAQVAEEACLHAGYDREKLSGRRWGVYVGHSAGSSQASHLTLATLAEEVAELLEQLPLQPSRRQELKEQFVTRLRQGRPHRQPGGEPFLSPHWAATLLARELGLDGPAAVIDAACASSLVALALGISALRSQEVEAVIVGGASQNKLESLLLFSQAQSCSATGSRPFDQGADGLVSSEGYVAMVLKTLDQAQADGDQVHAVIQGLGMSSDGRGKSLWAPNPAGQKAALERAYGQVLQPGQVQYVEAHATSTQVGDATEMESLSQFFAPHLAQKLPIGSLKSNLGHTLESAGLASLLKVVLAMEHGLIPSTLHVNQPNQALDWTHCPFEIVHRPRPWPQPEQRPRCAAVSAFGIGGLNVHVVVQQTAPAVIPQPEPCSPIAVIGRGVILPGAHDLNQLRRLLQEGAVQRQPPPADRWPAAPEGFQAGYVGEVPFDCVRHKIAPRYYKTGNPLQFMLLSAADQALQEVSGLWEPEQTAVIVGSAFGGEFADQLALGLRFPEIRQALESCLSEAEQPLLAQFESGFFDAYPALFDETGGFTSSTLASRLSKAYNLMGGALALDCGESSSHLAIKLACDLLRQRAVSTVLCAGGQRALNRVALESLQAEGSADVPGFFPGEGAAVVLLKRLDEAHRDGNPVLGVVQEAQVKARLPLPQFPEQDALSRLTGHLQSAQGVASLVATSLDGASGWLKSPACNLLVQGPPVALAAGQPLRMGATDLDQLRQNFLNWTGAPGQFSGEDGARLLIVDPAPNLLELARERPWDAAGRAHLQEHGIYLASCQVRPRLVFVFPGQGSQRMGMLDRLLATSPAARRLLEQAERARPDLTARLQSPALHDDPITTQLAVLVADLAFYQAALEDGLRPDCLCGHSFGEIPALVAADVLTLEDALQLTVVRAQALLDASPDGGLLSTRLSAKDLQLQLDRLGLPLHITHLNGPNQTVAGGRIQHLEQLQLQLEQDRVACRRLRVPGALHTPLVESARTSLSAYLQTLALRPPSLLVYSNVSNRPSYTAEEIRENLLEQLVKPVRWMDLQAQLYADGVRLFLEVGPGQVLTQLLKANLGQRTAFLLACDHPQRSLTRQLERARAALSCLGREILPTARRPPEPGALFEFDATQVRLQRRSRPEVAVPASRPGAGDSPVRRFVMDYLVDLTGFSAQAIDVHWDLEADLGIDSIKRTQLWGELKGTFPFQASEQTLADLRTVEQIVTFVETGQSQQKSSPAPVPTPLATSAAQPATVAEAEEVGRQHRQSIREKLRQAALLPAPGQTQEQVRQHLAPEQAAYLSGLARGAGVHESGVFAYQLRWGELLPRQQVTRRYALRLRPVPLPSGSPDRPGWYGPALIVGRNPLADELQRRLQAEGVQTLLVDPQAAPKDLPVSPHCFLVTPFDSQAEAGWNWLEERRGPGLTFPFWFCQRWLAQIKAAGLMDRASLVAITRMGGSLGLSAPLEALESGALSGLLKSIGIESWVAGYRSIAIKILDTAPGEEHQMILERLWRELAEPGYDREIGTLEGQRALLWAEEVPVQALAAPPLRGHWVCTGGARGITAYLAGEMARRFGLNLHLIGRAPLPQLPDHWQAMWPEQRRELRLEVMDEARRLGRNSVRYWEEVEKGLELLGNLRRLRQQGLEPRYYACDLSDLEALERVLAEIRRCGPIKGILHGAGVSRDAHFEDKQPERVEECLRAKVDGTLNLLRLTRQDELDYVVGFGSISGRFGANGHADYSLANEMLAKTLVWYRQQRPEVRAVAVHWHAWGEVGMAVKAETELGLKKIDMQFMPAGEGLEHLLSELQAGAPEPEVLITNRRYHRQFFFDSELDQEGKPLLGQGLEMWLDPEREVFLRDHCMQNQPVLPLAVSLQLLWECAGLSSQGACHFSEVEAVTPLKFFEGQPRRVRLSQRDGACRLSAEVMTRSGEMVDPQRLIARAQVDRQPMPELRRVRPPQTAVWNEVFYHPPGSDMVHGLSLRALRYYLLEDEQLWGRMTAPPLMELAGSRRCLAGWRVPSGLLDACFYACGVLAWHARQASQAVPVRLGDLWLGRLPRAGEHCEVYVRLQHDRYEFQVWGNNGEALVFGRDFEMACLSRNKEMAQA